MKLCGQKLRHLLEVLFGVNTDVKAEHLCIRRVFALEKSTKTTALHSHKLRAYETSVEESVLFCNLSWNFHSGFIPKVLNGDTAVKRYSRTYADFGRLWI